MPTRGHPPDRIDTRHRVTGFADIGPRSTLQTQELRRDPLLSRAFMRQSGWRSVSDMDENLTHDPSDGDVSTSVKGVAQDIARGVQRLLGDLDQRSILEFTVASGRRADVAALDSHGKITFVEIKSGLIDYRTDNKWPEYHEFCDYFYFAVDRNFPLDVLPDDVGLIVADRYGAEILRPSPGDPLHASRRKAVTLAFARVAAGRVTVLSEQVSESE